MEHCPPSPTTNSKVLKFTIEHILSKEPCGGSISGTGENSRRDWQSYLSGTNFKTSSTSKTLDLSRETSDGANSEERADPGKSSNRSKLYLRPDFLQCSTDFVNFTIKGEQRLSSMVETILNEPWPIIWLDILLFHRS